MMHIALLRGVNVGGHQLVAMPALREMFARLGFADARTLLQSGNVVFDSRGKKPAALERLLEREISIAFKLSIDVIVRDAAEWKSTIASNPFPREAKSDPSHLLVVFCKDTIRAAAAAALEAAIVGRERVRADGRQLYVVYPDGMGRSKLAGTKIEKTLGTRGTARNWNTILKLQAMIAEAPGI